MIGIGHTNLLPTPRMIEIGRLVDRAFDTFWIAEDVAFWRCATSIATALAATTKKLKVGIGIINPYSRSPYVIAMTIATIDELSNGRFKLGLGAGIRSHLESIGANYPKKPLTGMRESVELIRKLLTGDPVTYGGEVFRVKNAKLNLPEPKHIPIYLGAIGPRMLQLAGEIGDGAMLTIGAPTEYVKSAIEDIRKGAEQAGRDITEIDIVTYLIASISEDSRAAREAAREMVGLYIGLNSVVYPQIFERAKIAESERKPIIEAVLKGALKEAGECVTDEMIDAVAVAGTPEECIERIREYVDSGVKSPVLFAPIGPDIGKAIKLAEDRIVPKFR